MHLNNINGIDATTSLKQQTSKTNINRQKTSSETSKSKGVDIVNVTKDIISNNDIQFLLEKAYVKQQSDLAFEYLNNLKIQIISQELDQEALFNIKNQLSKNKKNLKYKNLEEILEEVLMRLEIELAKLDYLKLES